MGVYTGAGATGTGGTRIERDFFQLRGTYVVELERIVAREIQNESSKNYGQDVHIGEFKVVSKESEGEAGHRPGDRVKHFEMLQKNIKGAFTPKGSACMGRVQQFFASTFGCFPHVGAAAAAARRDGHDVPSAKDELDACLAVMTTLNEANDNKYAWVTEAMIMAAIGENGDELAGLKYRVKVTPNDSPKYTSYSWTLLED